MLEKYCRLHGVGHAAMAPVRKFSGPFWSLDVVVRSTQDNIVDHELCDELLVNDHHFLLDNCDAVS